MTKNPRSPAPIAGPSLSPRERLLDAAERLLIQDGAAALTTRRVAEEAGLNHGLVHYYFGSMEELLVEVLERFTDRLIVRQRDMYASDIPFIEKWRTAMAYLDTDASSGYQKLWFELQSLSWNRPELRDRVARVNAAWRQVLTEAFADAAQEYGVDTDSIPIAALVSLVMTFNQGIILERLSGIKEGQAELLEAIDGWLLSREKAQA
jgi:AcrR family transcriptional regulator